MITRQWILKKQEEVIDEINFARMYPALSQKNPRILLKFLRRLELMKRFGRFNPKEDSRYNLM